MPGDDFSGADRRKSRDDVMVGTFDALNKSIDLLAKTLDATQQIQTSQQKQLADQGREIRSIQESIVGHDEGITHYPGLRDIVMAHIKQDEDIIRNARWILRWIVVPVGALLLLVPFLHALGVPTTVVGKALGFPLAGN